MSKFTMLRKLMVEQQLVPMGIHDTAVLAAMGDISICRNLSGYAAQEQ